MASSIRNNVNTPGSQGRPFRPTLASNRSANSPLTPRLAANAATTPGTARGRTPATKADSGRAIPTTPGAIETPVRSLLTSNTTPQSTTRTPRERERSALATPPVTRASTRSQSPTKSTPVSGVFDRLTAASAMRSTLGVARPKSVISGRERTTSPPLVRSTAEVGMGISGIDQVVREASPMFFHANDVAKPELVQKETIIKKQPAFYYANGKEDETTTKLRLAKIASPPQSTLSDRRSPAPTTFLTAANVSEPALTPPLVSPALSSASSRSHYFSSPVTKAPSTVAPAVTPRPRDNVIAPASTSTLQITARSEGEKPASPLNGTTPVQRVPLSSQRKVSLGLPSTRPPHTKSPSMSTIEPVSPNASRRRSATNVGSGNPASPLAIKPSNDGDVTPRVRSPMLSAMDGSNLDQVASPSSPEKGTNDFAAEARRDRKVLDLEIRNSSLQAINRSLERELKKQKTELKRFRRLSRAGRFSIAADAPSSLATLDEDDLPMVNGDDEDAGRPSSPFLDDVTDMISDDEDDDDSSSVAALSSSAHADRQAKDEEKLQQDLRKHRELLRDTQRTNQTIQRCVLRSEDLLRDAQKALDSSVRSTDVHLGGHILSEEDGLDSPQSRSRDEMEEEAESGDGIVGFEAFLGLNQRKPGIGSSGSVSAGSSETADRDSGIEVGKPVAIVTRQQASPGAEPPSRSRASEILGETF